jgi:hypothetical protein
MAVKAGLRNGIGGGSSKFGAFFASPAEPSLPEPSALNDKKSMPGNLNSREGRSFPLLR